MDHIKEKRASARDWTLRLAEDGVTSCQEPGRLAPCKNIA